MSVLDKLEHVSDKYLGFAENHYFNAVLAILLLFTVVDEVILSFQSGFEDVLTKVEHGLFFIYLNLLIVSIARLCKAFIQHRKNQN
jgi:hypothetical protein